MPCHPFCIATERPPTGVVTFLFTDIEGSTRLVRQLRDRYNEVLAEHHSLLRTAFAAHGGHELDSCGQMRRRKLVLTTKPFVNLGGAWRGRWRAQD